MVFPRPLTRPGGDPYAFSCSGLKTAAARWVERHRLRREEPSVADGAVALPYADDVRAVYADTGPGEGGFAGCQAGRGVVQPRPCTA